MAAIGNPLTIVTAILVNITELIMETMIGTVAIETTIGTVTIEATIGTMTIDGRDIIRTVIECRPTAAIMGTRTWKEAVHTVMTGTGVPGTIGTGIVEFTGTGSVTADTIAGTATFFSGSAIRSAPAFSSRSEDKLRMPPDRH